MPRVNDQVLGKANAIRDSYVATAAGYKARRDLSDGAKLAAVAKATLKARAAMAKLQAEATAADDARRQQLTQLLFGTAGIQTGLDRASLSMSARDAGDRASQLASPEEAVAALSRAEDTGDEVMARAIAYQCSTFGWTNVLVGYAQTRPGVVDQLNELAALNAPSTSIVEMFAYVLPEPDGVQGRMDDQLQQLVDDPAFANFHGLEL